VTFHPFIVVAELYIIVIGKFRIDFKVMKRKCMFNSQPSVW
jgi:hypothetical protein